MHRATRSTLSLVLLVCPHCEYQFVWDAIAKNRELMGATDPKKADKGTIRADFADSIDANAVHGSDAPETAAVEIGFFFAGMNVYSR